MTKAKTTKRALLMSVLSMLLCLSMLVGSTFAWFTDSVTSGTNKIVAGNLDVEVTHTNKAAKDQPLQDAGNLFPVELWEPGVVSYETFTVINNGTLAFDYEFNFKAAGFNTVGGHSLKEVIKIGVIEGAVAADTTREQLIDAVKAVKKAGESVERSFAPFADFKYTDYMQAAEKDGNPAQSEKTFTVVAYWEPNSNDVDNLYNVNNGKKVEPEERDEEGNVINYLYIDIAVDVRAKQRTYESDSFDKNYDASTVFPLSDTNGTSYKVEENNGKLTLTSKDSNAAVFTADPGSKELTLTNGQKYSGDVVLPAAIAGEDGTIYTLTAIDDNAVGCSNPKNASKKANQNITSVIIPDTVKSIGDNAFGCCQNLTSANIPNSVETIGKNAFRFCTKITSITIPNSVTSISSGAFGSTSITEVTIPESITEIPTAAFAGCDKLTTVNIPNSVTTIGDLAFANCTTLTEIEIPDSVTFIDDEAFSGSGLESVEIPASVTTIAGHAFSGCKSLTQLIIPDTVTTMEDLWFQGCTNLVELVLPACVDPIPPAGGFKDCNSELKIYYFATELRTGKFSAQNNSAFVNAKKYVYSESKPTDSQMPSVTVNIFSGGTTEFEYWYWRMVDGVPTPWDYPGA